MTKKLQTEILDILDAFTPTIGGVPLQMLEYHLQHNKKIPYNEDELRNALITLLKNKKISRNVIAYKIYE